MADQMTDVDKRRAKQAARLLNETAERRRKMLLVAWLVGLAFICKAAVLVISVVLGEGSITFATAPLFGALWLYFLSEWWSARRSCEQLQATVFRGGRSTKKEPVESVATS